MFRVNASPEDIACPRCGYNLRGLTTPRCPECGLGFSFEDQRRGRLRENLPTRLDACDPWQPHQVLLWSLYELARAVFRPRRTFSRLDVNGPVQSAILMGIIGLAWLWLLTGGCIAAGETWRLTFSPASAIRIGLARGAPPILWRAVLGAATLLPPLTACIPWPDASSHQQQRIGAWALPVLACYGVLPLALTYVFDPVLAGDMLWTALVLPVLPFLAMVLRRSPRPNARLLLFRLVVSLLILAGGLTLGRAIDRTCIPYGLDDLSSLF